MKRAFEVQQKTFFIFFKGFSINKNCLRPESVPLKLKMNLFLVDGSRENQKTKGGNKNVVAKIIHNEYRNALLNKNLFETFD